MGTKNRSLRLRPNAIEAGTKQPLTLTVEGVSRSADRRFANKKCIIQVWEIDGRTHSSTMGRNDDKLAEFEATIVNLSAPLRVPDYVFEGVSRTDANKHEKLPEAETHKRRGIARSPAGSPIYVDGTIQTVPDKHAFKQPKYVPPHFVVRFPTKKGNKDFTVIIPAEKTHAESYVHHIAAQVVVDDTVELTTRRHPATVDSHHILAENCRMATEAMFAEHGKLVTLRPITRRVNAAGGISIVGVGNRFGTKWEKDLKKNKAAYTKVMTECRDLGLRKANCIIYVLEACALGHERTHAEADWKAIKRFMKKQDGLTLAQGLEKWGWVGIYYNHDVNNPKNLDWAPNQKPYMHSWRRNYHRDSYKRALRHKYSEHNVKVHDLVVNFAPTRRFRKWDPKEWNNFGAGVEGVRELNGETIPPDFVTKPTAEDRAKFAKLQKVPFGVINAVGSFHTALIVRGEVYEVHYSEGPTSPQLYGKVKLEDWSKSGVMRSGMIHVPRGSWEVPRKRK